MDRRLLLFVLFALVFQAAGQCDGSTRGAFDRNEVARKMEECKDAVDPFDCVDDLGVKPANLLYNFGYAVGFTERFGVRLNVSAMAHELYKECTEQLLEMMPDFFSIEVRKLMNSSHYNGCFDRESLCNLNKQFLYPFVCLVRRKCSMYLTDAFFALVYANQQLALETNEPLRCSTHSDQDLPHFLFSKGHVFQRGHVINRHFCRGVGVPPRRVIHENTVGEFKITIGLEYSW